MKNRIKISIGIVCIAFIMAFGGEIFSQLQHDDVMGLINLHNEKTNRTQENLNELYGKNYVIGNDGQINCDNDPQIYINNINEYVAGVKIDLKKISQNVMPIQIFYSHRGEAFSEENSIRYNYTDKSTGIININQNVSSLRIDIGDSKGDSYMVDKLIINPHINDYLTSILKKISSIRLLMYFLLCTAILIALKDFNKFSNYLFKYRWKIGILLILVCVLCKLNGSSIGILAQQISGYNTSKLWGTDRLIRSDEYVVFTQMALSQVKSHFKWFSSLWGYTPSDMFMTYGQPVMNLVTLYRPFSAGYLFLGGEYGLAFYWSSRLVFLFLISFEFGRVLSKDNRKLSLCYAILISLSPLVQWWYSVNELVEMLVFGQAAVLLINYYFKNCNNIIKKILYTIAFILCAGGYILTLYPAWMIPLFYIFLGCAIAVLIENKKNITIEKNDVIIWTCGLLALGISMIYIFKVSGTTIQATLNTAYPGQRRYNGGPFSNVIELFRGWSSYLWGVIDIPNPCEEVDFINFYPIGIILSLIVLFREKKKDVWLISLNIVNFFMTIYFLFELPAIIGKITLLNYSSQRMINAISLINLLILIRSMILIDVHKHRIKWIIPLTAIIIVLGFYCANGYLTESLKVIMVITGMIAVYLILKFLKDKTDKGLVFFVFTISIIGGATVNPINSGLDNIYNTKTMQAIEKINSNDKGTWIVNGNFPFANLPTIVGAKCVNCVQTYPDFEMWKKLGYTDKEQIWNRYAHINVEIAENDDLEIGPTPDVVNLKITIDKIKELGINYIFSTSNLQKYDELKCLYSYGDFSIWKVK